jgi:hypothetical protein
MRIEDKPKTPEAWNCNTGWLWLEPGQKALFRVRLISPQPKGLKLFGMRSYPGNRSDDADALDSSKVSQIVLYGSEPEEDCQFEVSRIFASGQALKLPSADKFFPFIDGYGQFIHKEWKNKIHSQADLDGQKDAETKDLSAHPGPKGWDKYGGWEAGPKQKATGAFYPKKIGGRWRLVDPDGMPFFSHGLSVVNLYETTPLDGREAWFKDFPGEEDAFKEFSGSAEVGKGYYEGKTVKTFDFRRSNLRRKYGENWKEHYVAQTHARLKSWGFNTLGNWSSPEFTRMARTPYVVAVHPGGYKSLGGSKGFWQPFADVFDASFKRALDEAMGGQSKDGALDPFCMGYFVDNELSWDDDTALALSTLASPEDQEAKKVFVSDLKAKYAEIGRLNRAWGSKYASWDDLQRGKTEPDGKLAEEDLKAFSRKTAETYFKLCRGAVKEVAPQRLYLGCRFAWYGEIAERAAAKYCDVLSYNLYRRGVETFKLPEGVDAPVIIGEFHFGALDRGMFDPGMVEVKDQAERGEAYREYVSGALKNPLIVGCHYFQYADQPVTGRSLDGEPAQIGFVDIADTAYEEMVAASRGMGEELYHSLAVGRREEAP